MEDSARLVGHDEIDLTSPLPKPAPLKAEPAKGCQSGDYASGTRPDDPAGVTDAPAGSLSVKVESLKPVAGESEAAKEGETKLDEPKPKSRATRERQDQGTSLSVPSPREGLA